MEKLWHNKKIACIILILIVAACTLAGCREGSQEGGETAPSEEPATAVSEISNETVESRIPEDDSTQKDLKHKEGESQEDKKAEKMMRLYVNDEELSVTWEDNESVEALKKLVSKEPLTIEMSRYGGFEQVGSIGQTLPRNDKQTTTGAGDIVLYSGDQIVTFYGSNSWSYTRLGHIEDRTKEELTQMLGEGNVSLTIRIDQ